MMDTSVWCVLWSYQHEIPGPSEETKERIRQRIQREINGRALLATLKEQRP